MGNLQGSEKKSSGKTVVVGGKTKGKKSPIRELFKNQGIKKGLDEQVGSNVVDPSSANCSLVVTTESWRRVKELQGTSEVTVEESLPSQSLDVQPTSLDGQEAIESSSEESVFTDPLLTPLYSVHSDYSDSKPCGSENVCAHVISRAEDNSSADALSAEAVMLTMIMTGGQRSECDDDDAEATPLVSRRRPSSTSTVVPESGSPGPASTPSLSQFTITKHCKIELQPSKCLVSPTPSLTSAVNNNGEFVYFTFKITSFYCNRLILIAASLCLINTGISLLVTNT